MAMRFSSVTCLVLLSVATLLSVHASARTLQQTQTLPLHGGANAPTKAESPLEDQKNFIYGGGIGGVAGVGGFLGMPLPGGIGNGMTLPLPVGSGPFGGLGGGPSGGGGIPSSP